MKIILTITLITLVILCLSGCTGAPMKDMPDSVRYKIFAGGFEYYVDNYTFIDGRLVLDDFYERTERHWLYHSGTRYFGTNLTIVVTEVEDE